ncbi:unnamed protein product [Calypogeia fissa]
MGRIDWLRGAPRMDEMASAPQNSQAAETNTKPPDWLTRTSGCQTASPLYRARPGRQSTVPYLPYTRYRFPTRHVARRRPLPVTHRLTITGLSSQLGQKHVRDLGVVSSQI